MANKRSGFTETLPREQVKASDSGHAQDAARRAPLKSKESVLLGGEQTSDALVAEGRQMVLQGEARKRNEKKKTEDGIPKKVRASLKPVERTPSAERR
jgi:hypothetical protein